ncbi:type I-B CRISPR-associated protein Cas7/Cst2/DevR [Methanobrevibacter sp. UBA337]|jgi:CRISPR-associated protein Cst2|uniref:type I-B CRISPR-associated protein Cas7/Cst2/DevR n=1 Tax=Methanobrevibacter sp. UBA337 TaxID=1915480 RepID=UPI0039B85661
MSKNVIGFMLIDAPHSALNNAGNDYSDRTDNMVKVKTIWKGGKSYPYVSGQALRYWWRETLESKFNWEMSPIVRDKKIAFTSANPIDYPDDDMFGYMRALSKKEGGTVTRRSVLSNSPLVSVVGQNPSNDFGVMARHEGDPVPYEHEFYSTILKGIFSINLDTAGKFYTKETTGYRNMYPDLVKLAEEKGLTNTDDAWVLDYETRIKRVEDIIKALPYLYGGAKQAAHLTDVTPKFLILTSIDGGNHFLMNIIKEEEKGAKLDIEALKEVLNDYKDILLTKVYIGFRKGFLNNKTSEQLEELSKENDKIVLGSINQIVDEFNKEIPKLVEK